MKKIYIEPEIDVVVLHPGVLMAGSPGAAQGVESDGGVTPSTPDQDSEDWGSDY